MLNLRAINQQGDTIVEVLIAIAIVGSVLVGAFQITNRNTQQMQQAQEYGQASKLVQSQIEYLRNASFNAGSDRCFGQDGKATSTAANCIVNSSGASSTAVPNYTLSIESSDSTNYTIKAVWDSATGNGQANVTTYYRL